MGERTKRRLGGGVPGPPRLHADSVAIPREESARSRLLLDALQDGVCVADWQGRITEVNKAFELMVGIRREDVIGTSDLFPWWESDERLAIVAALTSQLESGHAHHEFEFARADGERFPVSLELTRLGAGPRASVMGVVRDLSTEVAERRRRRDAERIASLSTWEIDPATEQLTGSTGLLAAAGIQPGEKLTVSEFLSFVPEPDAQEIRDALASLVSDRDDFVIEHRIAGENPEVRWMEVHGQAVRDEAGRLLQIRGATQDITGRRKAADALRGSRELSGVAERIAGVGSFEVEESGAVRWSQNLYRLFEVPPGFTGDLQATALERIFPDDLPAFAAMREQVRGDGIARTIDHRYCRGEETRWAETRFEPLLRDDVIVGLRGTLQDITERRRDEEEARLQAHLLDVVDASVIATDPRGVVTHWNAKAEELYGWTATEAIGQPISELTIARSDRAEAERTMAEVQSTGTWSGEFAMRHKDGTEFTAFVQTSLYTDEHGAPAGVIGTSVDLTERIDLEGSLRAARDYMRAVTDSIGEGMFSLDEEGRLIYINPAAQKMLGWSPHELAGEVVHHAIHYRHPDGSPYPIEDCPISRTRELRETFRIDSDTFIAKDGTEVSVEYTSSPIETTEGLKGCVVVFSDISERLEREREVEHQIESLSWIGRIHDALENERFVVHAQPIVDLSNGAVVQHELLIRMIGPDGSLVPPGKFLPIAEEFGVIGEIDRWMTGQAADLAAAGHRVHLNLSALSIGSPHATENLLTELSRTGAEPENLIIELTETALINEEDDAQRFTDRLRSIGCPLALDDFGSGYGGFSYLKRYPVDYLKIDREFVADLVGSDASRYVVTAVVNLAAGLGQKTVAEGVEDAATMELLRELGVDFAQGFHIAKPGPANEVLKKENGR